MKRIFLLVLLLCTLVIPYQHSEASPLFPYEFNPALLQRMHNNPNNYLYAVGLGNGIVYYIEKSSINVEWSNKNETVINAKTVHYVYFPERDANGYLIERTAYIDDKPLRIAYNHATHNVFKEIVDENGKTSWRYLDTSNHTDYEYYKRGDGHSMCVAETLYYYTMNKPFFNPPLTYNVINILKGEKETYTKMMNFIKSTKR